ncbi:amino acid ABC transporter ATP-binding/permease protein [Desulfoscipio gibsoniae]
MRRSWLSIATRLTALIGSLLPVMLIAVVLGVLGFLSAIFLIIFAAFALLNIIGVATTYTTIALLGAIVLCAGLRGVLRYGEQLAGHYLAFRLLAVLRDKVFFALRRLAPAKLEKRDSGDLVSLITGDIELLEVFYAHTVAPVLIALCTSILMTLFIGSMNVGLGFVAAVAYITVGVLIPACNSRTGKARGVKYRAVLGAANNYFLESLLGIGEIIRYGRGASRKEALSQITARLDQEQARLKRREGLTGAATDTAIMFFSGVVLCLGLHMVFSGRLEFHRALLATVAMLSSFGPVVALSNLSGSLLQTMAAGARVLDLLEEEPETPEVQKGAEVCFNGACCENVGFAYGGEDILRKVHFNLPKNRITGICGKSGSGKSTLLKLLMRFWDVREGCIRISGEDIRCVNTENLRCLEGYVTQDTFLFQTTLENNIRLAKPEASMSEVRRAAESAGIHRFIRSLPKGYQTRVGELGEGLSGGERQRIGLARAFLHGAPLLLLDEPTSNLDSLNEASILKSLRKAAGDRAIVLVSHRASTLRIADMVHRMECGRLS